MGVSHARNQNPSFDRARNAHHIYRTLLRVVVPLAAPLRSAGFHRYIYT